MAVCGAPGVAVAQRQPQPAVLGASSEVALGGGAGKAAVVTGRRLTAGHRGAPGGQDFTTRRTFPLAPAVR
ncbi:hypothetical protein GCM10009759_08810 [Kitasatospora saccharophila]|uniref:Uncharacterized protein n=1 Tax=Kitasatospora saccharophila TaxID=407973 RepID=A0ABN2WAI9_9ACTN